MRSNKMPLHRLNPRDCLYVYVNNMKQMPQPPILGQRSRSEMTRSHTTARAARRPRLEPAPVVRPAMA